MNLFSKSHDVLIKGCRENKRSAQEKLYKAFYAEMLRVCYRYLKSDDLAQDALNASFLKVFQHISSFDDKKGELGAWIRTIVIRTCIDLGRKEIRFVELHSLTEETEDIFISPSVLEKLYAEDLLQSIRLLPVATQLVFNLSVIEGYTHKEIAEQLNISEGTSRWHLSEAKRLLRTMLAPAENSINQPTENNKAT